MATYQAKVHPSWFRTMILRSLIFWAFAAVFVYDGAYAWPKKTVMAQKYLDFVEAGNSMHDWPEHAKKEGLGKVKKTYSQEDIKSQRQLNEQFWCAGGLILVALGILGKMFVDRGKWVGFDETALIAPDGRRVELDRIESISTEKWEKKGLAYVRYRESDGPATEGAELKKLTIDDLKYNGAEKVLEKAQAHMGQPLESEKRAAAKAAEAAEAAAESTDQAV